MHQIPQARQFFIALYEKLKKNIVLFFVFTVFTLIAANLVLHKDNDIEHFVDFLDPFAGIATLFVAIGIALENYHKSWKESLPKTLTVHFIHDKSYYLSCYFADLTAEGDIRTWAQQIGRQMTGGNNLDFDPFFNLKPPKVVKLKPSNLNYLHFEVNYLLNEPPKMKKEKEAGKYIRWFVAHKALPDMDENIKLKLIEPTGNLETVDFNYATNNRRAKEKESSPTKKKFMTNENLAEILVDATFNIEKQLEEIKSKLPNDNLPT